MPAPEISSFGDESHAPGESGIPIDGGGFGAFPGSVWIYANADLTGAADELDVVSWNDIAISVDIPASLTNTAGMRYLFVQREDLAWSNALGFTLESAAGETASASDSVAVGDASSALAAALSSVSEGAACADTALGIDGDTGVCSDSVNAAESVASIAGAFTARSDSAVASDEAIAASSADVSIVGAVSTTLTETLGMRAALAA